MMINSKIITPIIVIAASTITVLLWTSMLLDAKAYDNPPVVDPSGVAARSLEQPVYRFGPSVDDQQVYQDGTTLPTRTFSIEQWNPTTQKWEIIGYANTHLHKVKIDATDKMDISVGSTTRINPKN